MMVALPSFGMIVIDDRVWLPKQEEGSKASQAVVEPCTR